MVHRSPGIILAVGAVCRLFTLFQVDDYDIFLAGRRGGVVFVFMATGCNSPEPTLPLRTIISRESTVYIGHAFL